MSDVATASNAFSLERRYIRDVTFRDGLGDTSAASTRRYFDLLRGRSIAQRGAILAGLVASVRRLAEASVKTAHPDASDREVKARVAARIYGAEIAMRFFPEENLR